MRLFPSISAKNWVYSSVFAYPMHGRRLGRARSSQVTPTPSRKVPPRSPNLPASATGNASAPPSAWRPTHSARAPKVWKQRRSHQNNRLGLVPLSVIMVIVTFFFRCWSPGRPSLRGAGLPPRHPHGGDDPHTETGHQGSQVRNFKCAFHDGWYRILSFFVLESFENVMWCCFTEGKNMVQFC